MTESQRNTGRNLVNFAAFQAAWFACVVGAARGWFWLGPVVAVAAVGLHLATACARARELILIAAVGILGTVVDAALIAMGFFAPLGDRGWLPPAWFIALWPAFATLLNGCLGWMSGRYVLGAVCGAVGGPLSYWSAARLGAIRLHANTALGLSAVAIEWAIVTPVLLRMAKEARR